MSTFVMTVRKLTARKGTSSVQYQMHDPDQKTLTWTAIIQQTMQFENGHRLWRVRIDFQPSPLEEQMSCDLQAVALIESCDQNEGTSRMINGDMPKVLFDGQQWYHFAAHEQSFVRFLITRRFVFESHFIDAV